MILHRTLRARAAWGERGFTLMEVTFAGIILTGALVALAGLLVYVSHLREQSEIKNRILLEAANVVEQIRSQAPSGVTGFNGTEHEVTDVDGNFTDGKALQVSVVTTQPYLATVTLVGSWQALGNTETVTLTTRVHTK